MNAYRLHVAGFDDLDPRTAYLLWQLRIDVFVVEQACAYPELDGRDLEPGTRHIWLDGAGGVAADGSTSDGAGDRCVPVACLRVLTEPGPVRRIGRVCVAAHARGEGLAARLMEAALVEIGDQPSVLDAQVQMRDWYVRLGYRVDGPEFLEDGIAHVPMRRAASGSGQP